MGKRLRLGITERAMLSGMSHHLELSHVTGHKKQKKFVRVCTFVSCGLWEILDQDVGVFQEHIRLDKEFILEGGDGADAGRLTVFWKDDIRQCYRGRSYR